VHSLSAPPAGRRTLSRFDSRLAHHVLSERSESKAKPQPRQHRSRVLPPRRKVAKRNRSAHTSFKNNDLWLGPSLLGVFASWRENSSSRVFCARTPAAAPPRVSTPTSSRLSVRAPRLCASTPAAAPPSGHGLASSHLWIDNAAMPLPCPAPWQLPAPVWNRVPGRSAATAQTRRPPRCGSRHVPSNRAGTQPMEKYLNSYVPLV